MFIFSINFITGFSLITVAVMVIGLITADQRSDSTWTFLN